MLPLQPRLLDLDAVFGRQAPRVLEIGFGMGDATAAVAAAMPGTDFIGVEVHVPGVGALLKRIGEQGLTNLRLVQDDAVQVLQQMIPPAALAGVHIWFPDPWHKKRHNKRRLVQPAFVKQLLAHIAPGGYLHCATDWQPYAEQMLEVLSAEPGLVNTATDADRRLRAAPRLAAADEVREPRHPAGPRRVGPGVQALQLTRPVQAVSSTTPPNTMRYHAKSVKSWVDT